MYINPNWNYSDIVKNMRTLRLQYEEVLASFLFIRDQNNFILTTRNNLYALHFDEYRKDKIWEYINGDLSQFDVFMIFGFLDPNDEDEEDEEDWD